MKNAALHAREFKKLLKRIRRENAAPFPNTDEPMEQLLRGILTDYASEARANVALARLREGVVDINEMRVTPVSEIVEIIGVDFPLCRRAAEDIVKALNATFNKLHHLDLAFLKKVAKRSAQNFLDTLDGVNEHARASVILRCIRAHAVPADVVMCEILRRENCVEPGSSVADIHRFLAAQIKESQAASFYAQFKRYAAAHAPKKPIVTRSKAIPSADAPKPVPVEQPKPEKGGTVVKPAKPAKSGKTQKAKAPRPAKPAAKRKQTKARKSAGKSSKRHKRRR